MDAKRIEFLAHDGLRSFETLDLPDATLIAISCLSAILEGVTDDVDLQLLGERAKDMVLQKTK